MSQQQSNSSSVLVQGRIVWTSGNLFTGQHLKDDKTKQLRYNQDGSPVIQFGFGLAIPKFDPQNPQAWHPEYVKIYQALQAEALTLFPGGNIPPGFAMKYKDGDVDIDPSGRKYSEREGYANHIVLACTTYIPIKYFKHDGQQNFMVNEGIKNGDYVNVQVNIKAHPAVGQGKAGLYVNPSAVQLIAPGKEIINTPSGDQLFGTNAPAYSGQIQADTAPTMPNMSAPAPQQGGMPPVGGQQYAQPQGQPSMPGQGAQPAYTQPPVNTPPPAHYGVLPQSHQPAPTQGQPPMSGQGAQPAYTQPQQGGMPPMPGIPR